jgi:hypothetical protein
MMGNANATNQKPTRTSAKQRKCQKEARLLLDVCAVMCDVGDRFASDKLAFLLHTFLCQAANQSDNYSTVVHNEVPYFAISS